ncbi:MAG: heparinase II/III family protein [Chloroherpetonaceae bacterium]|nr:heparinase II/III family protein [Chloroherpetonaceae bacterium]MDW8437700.1 alginate lyase family protein [Chloroherpetonaceae bacterium]
MSNYFRIVQHRLALRGWFALRTRFFRKSLSDAEFFKLFAFEAKSAEEFLRLFARQSRHDFFFNLGNRKEFFLQLLSRHDSPQNVIMRAEALLGDKVSLFGASHRFENGWNWGLDLKTKREFDTSSFFTKVSIPSGSGSDIKFPWELSRFHFAWTLGKAYWLTNRLAYKEKFIALVSDWQAKNPFGYGINWHNAMEVAIRAANLVAGFYFFCDGESDAPFWISLLKLLYEHGDYIEHNLEYTRRSGNHLVADALGLLTLGVFFKQTKKGQKWIRGAKKILEEEIFAQTFYDGVDYEMSVAYHRFVAEMFFVALVLMERQKTPFEAGYKARLQRMLDFVFHYLKPDGSAPLVGDSDDGRFFNVNPDADLNNHLDLLSAASVVFSRADYKAFARNYSELALWLLGAEGFERFQRLPSQPLKRESKLFRNSGFAIMQSENAHVFIDAGELGKRGWGGHGHNDTFSFELFANGANFVTDSGTLCYTSDRALRNRFRSIRAHNGVMIDDEELAEFAGDFKVKKDPTRPRISKWESSADEDVLEAEHFAYRALPEPVAHKRRFHLKKRENLFIVSDALSAIGEHKAEWNFHFAPEIELEQIGSRKIVATSQNGATLSIEFDAEGKDVIISDDLVSRRYGESEKAKTLRLRQTFRRELEFQIRFSF